MSRLKNKVAIITGALGGQGQVAVRRFVEEGAKVLASDMAARPNGEVAALIKAKPSKAGGTCRRHSLRGPMATRTSARLG